MSRRRRIDLTFEFVIATATGGSRGGCVSAETHVDATAQVSAMLREGERIYLLRIRTT